MTFTETDSTRRGIAFHEAGHAVVAWTLGQRVSSIRIHAESNRETSGTMRSKKQRYGSRALQMLFEAHESCRDIAPAIQIVVSFAGVLAQMQVEEEALAKDPDFAKVLKRARELGELKGRNIAVGIDL